MNEEQLISELESLIRRDPARRGLIGTDEQGPGRGELAAASLLFKENVSRVGLLTGFFVPELTAEKSPTDLSRSPDNLPGHAETDGPLGTIMLADVLTRLGIPVTLITDELCLPVVQAACTTITEENISILACPVDPIEAAVWRTSIPRNDAFNRISHLVAIERVGPGHTLESIQCSETSPEVLSHVQNNLTSVLLPGHCCNMRGENINAYSADLHLLFETATLQAPAIHTVGIGDGGNEVGMGRFRWGELRTRIPGQHADRIPCRIATDRTIVAGVSNWGAYALAAAIAVRRNRLESLESHTARSQQIMLERIVYDAGAVDGVTCRNEPTVDGLPFLTQIQPWAAIRKQLGLKP